MNDRADDVLQTLVGSGNDAKQVSYSEADLRRVKITHGPHAIDVVAQFGDLRPTSWQLFEVQLRALGRAYYGDGVGTRDDPTALSVQWELRYLGNTLTLRCPGATARADFSRNRVFMTVPTFCLGTPPWVRVNVRNIVNGRGGTTYEDGLDEGGSGGDTPRVYRP